MPLPESLSASSIQVADLCPSRWFAEYFSRGKGMGNVAASNGTAVHGALELYVKQRYLEGVFAAMTSNADYLIDLYRISYMTVFDTADTDTPEFEDGIDMLKRWWMRTTPYLEDSDVKVLSCEIKESFPIVLKDLGVEIPFNYIFDRSDQIGEHEFRVVDYKTQRIPIPADQLRKKVQVRAYGLAMQILHPEAKEIWVELDFLRHDGPVGVRLKKDDNIAAWNYFKLRARQIIDMPEPPEERLNPECRFCVRKVDCGALGRHIAVGGILGRTAEELVDIRAQLEWQKSAIESTIGEIDEHIMTEARETEVFEWSSDDNEVVIGTTRGQRKAEPTMVEKVIGEELFKRYGSHAINMGAIDKLLKGKELSDEKKKQLRSLIYMSKGNPKIYVKSKSAIDEE